MAQLIRRTKQRIVQTIPLETKRQKLVAILVLIIIFAVLIPTGIVIISKINSVVAGTEVTRKYTGKLQKTPDYATILPEGKSIEALGGWTRVSPPESNAVFAYVDMINGKQINVSQQPLPLEFKEETNSQIEKLAAGYKATEKVTVGDTTVFIGTSAKGPQSVIFVKNDLLILIKSSVAISEDEWASYVNTLK